MIPQNLRSSLVSSASYYSSGELHLKKNLIFFCNSLDDACPTKPSNSTFQMKSKYIAVLAFLSLALSGAKAASVTVTGGSPSGTIELHILNDIAIAPKPGESFAGYLFKITIPGAISSDSTHWNGASAFNIPSTANPPLTYQTSDTASILSMTSISMTVYTQGNNALVMDISDPSYADVLIEEGGSVTFKAGIYSYDTGGTVTLQDPGKTYDLTIANFSSITESGSPRLSGTTATFVPEPSASFMALLGMAGCVLRRRR